MLEVKLVFQINDKPVLVLTTEGMWVCVVQLRALAILPTWKEPLAPTEQVAGYVLVRPTLQI